MADVFISYKREDRDRVAPLAQALERLGYTVWWDLNLLSGERWESRIRTELDAAKCVLVIWTAKSVTADRKYASEWVEIEANEAKRRGVMIPALLDDQRVPWTHQMVQSSDLVGWRGDVTNLGFVKLREGVERFAGTRSAPASPEVEAWIAAEKTSTVGVYHEFLAKFPHSRFTVLAEARAIELGEAQTWETLGPSPSLEALQVFLKRYPDGRFAERAQASIRKLKPQRWKLSPGQIAAWIGVPTAIFTLIIAIANFGALFPKRPDEGPWPEVAAVEASPAEAAAEAPAPSSLDARSTPASTRAPLVTNPANLPDFSLFRECENCPEMVVIPAESFSMGSPASESGRSEDEDSVAGAGGAPVSVRITRFAVSRFPVTRGEYAAFSTATSRAVEGGCYTDRAKKGSWVEDPAGTWRDPAFPQTDRHPVVCVNFAEAAAFAAWTQRRTDQPYRLISEAEYEYANRAGTNSAYFWGADINQGCVFANVADATAKAAYSHWTTATCNDGYERTSPVGAFRANPWGLFDTTGNAWSWTADCYADSYAGALTNGAAATTKSCAIRVNRGGSWGSFPRRLRSAGRFRGSPTVRYFILGFRLARTL